MNYCIRGTTQLKKDSTELVNFCLNYFTLEAGESRFTEVAFSSCCDSWPVCCAGGGGASAGAGEPGDTGIVGAGCAPAGSWVSLSSCVQNVSVARVLLGSAELS